MNATPLLGTILDGLAAEKLEAVLIGNAAAAIQGAPVTTLDFDFMFRDTSANLAKLKRMAKRLDAVIFTPLHSACRRPRFYRLMSDATGLRVDFLPAGHGRRELGDVGMREPVPHSQSRRPIGAPATSKHPPATAGRDDPARDTLAAESDAQLDDLIRRRLALPVEARMNFLRRRLPGGGSSL